jgi:hypothetical protein
MQIVSTILWNKIDLQNKKEKPLEKNLGKDLTTKRIKKI